jgi:hypothetical protein
MQRGVFPDWKDKVTALKVESSRNILSVFLASLFNATKKKNINATLSSFFSLAEKRDHLFDILNTHTNSYSA